MEMEKRRAVENEDYDKAKVKKLQMDEFRLLIYKDINVHDLLETSGARHSVTVDLDTHQQPTPRLVETEQRSFPPALLAVSPGPLMPYDERPVPAMKNTQSAPPAETSSQATASPTPYSEHSLPVYRKRGKLPAVLQDKDSEQK